MSYQTPETIERRRRIIRIILFFIILSTMPFYCAGFLLWGTSGQTVINASTPATFTPIGGDQPPTRLPTLTPLPLTVTVASPLRPTPLQFIPINPVPGSGGGGGVVPTVDFIGQPTV